MTTIKILTAFKRRLCSDLHPLYRWAKELREQEIQIQTFYDYNDKGLKDSDVLIIYNRDLRNQIQNQDELITYLVELKKTVKKLIWYDTADSSGTMDFGIIPYVDVFLKKQILKELRSYTGENGNTQVRVWLDPNAEQIQLTPCPADMVDKIKLGWNLAYYDYRPYDARVKQIVSNSLPYWLYPLRFNSVNGKRSLDTTYRGSLKSDEEISRQRNELIRMLPSLNLNTAHGGQVSQTQYLNELSDSKVSISPFGWGEVCYRDFETFICGSLLIKPFMGHLTTFPDIFIENETYIPLRWDLKNFKDSVENIVDNYENYKTVAVNGQNMYKAITNDSNQFIKHLKQLVA